MKKNKKSNKWVEEKRKEWGFILRKAYQQKEDVDEEKLLNGLRSKVSDPNGWDFLEGWTWSWIKKLLTQTQQETLEWCLDEVEKRILDISKNWSEKDKRYRTYSKEESDEEWGHNQALKKIIKIIKKKMEEGK
jgi:hypothetical protein